MNKTIDTLVEDIYAYVSGDVLEYVNDNLSDLGRNIEDVYNRRFKQADTGGVREETNALRLSAMGTKCVRKLWYRQNTDGCANELHPNTRIKFFFGDILEEILLQLARDSGHTVTGEQDELVFSGIKGHRDAVIDGVTIDCKSSSSFSFHKFREGLKPESDAFGYLTQLEGYVYAATDDPLVINKTLGGFLAIDKQHGHICLDLHTFDNPEVLAAQFEETKETVNNPMVVPPRAFRDEPDGKSGNRKLGVACSYCEFKDTCWPGLRTFVYSNGPRFLTNVVKEPNVYEDV